MRRGYYRKESHLAGEVGLKFYPTVRPQVVKAFDHLWPNGLTTWPQVTQMYTCNQLLYMYTSNQRLYMYTSNQLTDIH